MPESEYCPSCHRWLGGNVRAALAAMRAATTSEARQAAQRIHDSNARQMRNGLCDLCAVKRIEAAREYMRASDLVRILQFAGLTVTSETYIDAIYERVKHTAATYDQLTH